MSRISPVNTSNQRINSELSWSSKCFQKIKAIQNTTPGMLHFVILGTSSMQMHTSQNMEYFLKSFAESLTICTNKTYQIFFSLWNPAFWLIVWVCLRRSTKRILSIYRKFWCLSSCKKSTSFPNYTMRYYDLNNPVV